MITKGTNQINKIAVGSNEIGRIYLGNGVVYGGEGEEVLPYDAELEYLESSGTQYIDTGILATIETKAEIRFAGVFDNKRLLCTRTANWTNQFDIILYDNTQYGFLIRIGNGNGYQKRYKPTTNNAWYTLVVDKNGATINSSAASSSYGTLTINNPYNIILFAGGGDILGLYGCSAKVSYCKLYDNGTLVADFIPVRVGTVGYMYDKVTKQLFGNDGTGDFILGSDK